MPCALTLPLDDAAAAEVQRMWLALAEQADTDDAIRLNYKPHITLAVLPDAAPVARVEEAAFGVAACWSPSFVVLAGLGVFPGTPPVIWLAPIVTADLLAKHAEICLALSAFDVHPHYERGAWLPHVTLSQAGSVPLARVVETASSAWRAPIGARLERVELVRFHPVEILRSQVLKGSQ